MHRFTLRHLYSTDIFWISSLLTVTLLLNVLVERASGSMIRPLVAALFFLFCPGMALVRLLQLRQAVLELTLGVALSIALAMLTSELLIYTHNWDTTLGLRGMSLIVIIGCGLQIVQHLRRTIPTETPP